jgi:hypothetical protein
VVMEKGAKAGEQSRKKWNHGPALVAKRSTFGTCFKCLCTQSWGILATDSRPIPQSYLRTLILLRILEQVRRTALTRISHELSLHIARALFTSGSGLQPGRVTGTAASG